MSDTSVLIELERSGQIGGPPPLDLSSGKFYVSVVTMSELLVGTQRGRPDRRAKRMRFAESVFPAIVILGIGTDIARIHARLTAEMLDIGRPTASHDLWIAATAIQHDLDVWTCDEHSFPFIHGLRVTLFPKFTT